MGCKRIRVDSLDLRGLIHWFLFPLLLPAVFSLRLPAQTSWTAIGPDGGDARAIAAVPGHSDHLYLGTTNSRIYESTDGGSSWHGLSQLGTSDDLVIDHILVDPANPAVLYAAAWALGRTGGGLWVSHDGGRNWSEAAGLHAQSIRAFVQAPSDPSISDGGHP